MDYEIKVASYNKQMDELQGRQREFKATAGRLRMDAFREHIHSGEKPDTADAVMLRQLANRTVVYDAWLEIHLRIGVALEQTYAH